MADSSPRQTDWVKILGLAVAVLIFFGAQFFVAQRNQQRQRALDEQQAKENREGLAAEAAQGVPATKAPLGESPNTAPGELKSAPSGVEPKTGEKKAGGEKPGETKPGEAPPKAGGPEHPTAGPPGPPPVPAVPPPPAPPLAPDVHVTGDCLDLVFSARGAGLKHASLADEKLTATSATPGLELLDEIEPGRTSLGIPSAKLGAAVYTDLESRVWELTEDSHGFTGDPPRWTVAYATVLREGAPPYKEIGRLVKRFQVGQADRHVEVQVQFTNATGAAAHLEYGLRGAAGILLDGPPTDPRQGAYVNLRASLAGRATKDDEPQVITVAPDAALAPEEDKRKLSAEENLWAAVSNRFFMATLISRQAGQGDLTQIVKIVGEPIKKDQRTDKHGDLRYSEPNVSPVFFTWSRDDLAQGAQTDDRYAFYMGPSKEDTLAAYEEQLALPRPVYLHLAVQYCDIAGWRWPNMDRLARALLFLFRGLAGVMGSYGVAVILLTLVVKLALHPFQRKMTVSMFKMQLLQPQLKALEKKYEGQTSREMKQKREMEKVDLMRKEGVNPTMGCLPMLIQMPIFFALFGAFSRAFEIRQAGFLWIKDLSLPDRLANLNFWPHEFNLLPLLYTGLSLYQGLKQPKPVNADPQQDLSRQMMLFMPVIFGFLFYKMASGLILYFAASAVFGLLETWYVRHHILKVDRHNNPLPGSVVVAAVGKSKGGKSGLRD